MPESNVCKKCPQKDCGMRNHPKSWAEINYSPPVHEPPANCLACYFYICGNAGDIVIDTISDSRNFASNGLAKIDTYDKPFQGESRPHGITGRFANDTGDVFIIKNGELIFLANPIENPPPRILELFRMIGLAK